MTAYHSVPVAMYDRDFSKLSRNAQVLELYLRTCPQRSTEGLFRFGVGAAEDDLGIPRAELLAAMDEISHPRRPFMFDRTASVVLDMTALQVARTGVPKKLGAKSEDTRLPGALSKLRALPETPLMKQLYVLAGKAGCDVLAEHMRAEFDLPEPDTDAFANIPSRAPSDAPSDAPSRAPSRAPSDAPSRARARVEDEESKSKSAQVLEIKRGAS